MIENYVSENDVIKNDVIENDLDQYRGDIYWVIHQNIQSR